MKLDRLQYQIDAVLSATNAFDINKIIIDDNFCANPILNNTKNIDVKMETGTGKTYCSLAICKQFNLKPIIICGFTLA